MLFGSFLYPLICSADGVTRKEYSASKRELVKPSPESVVNRIPKKKNGSTFRASYQLFVKSYCGCEGRERRSEAISFILVCDCNMSRPIIKFTLTPNKII